MIMTTIMSLAQNLLLPRFSRKERTSAIQIRNHSYQFNEGDGTETLRLLHRTPPPLHNVLPQSWLTWSGRSCTPAPTSKSSRISMTEGIPFRFFWTKVRATLDDLKVLWILPFQQLLTAFFGPQNTFPGFSEGMWKPTIERQVAETSIVGGLWHAALWIQYVEESKPGNHYGKSRQKLQKHVTPMIEDSGRFTSIVNMSVYMYLCVFISIV